MHLAFVIAVTFSVLFAVLSLGTVAAVRAYRAGQGGRAAGAIFAEPVAIVFVIGHVSLLLSDSGVALHLVAAAALTSMARLVGLLALASLVVAAGEHEPGESGEEQEADESQQGPERRQGGGIIAAVEGRQLTRSALGREEGLSLLV